MLNSIYKTSYIPYTVEGECVHLPLTEIGNLVSLEDSLYSLEKSKYDSPQQQKPSNSNPVVNNSGSTTYHKVKSGESLGVIAKRYGTTVESIKKLNNLTSSNIVVGQRLKINGTSSSSNNSDTSSSKQYYKVRSGDTFGRIAQRHGKTITQLKRLNPGINIDRLSIGQKIRVK